MRFLAVMLLLAPALPGQGAPHADLTQIQTVYLLPMANGLDQYLANHLTREGIYRVVTDPQKADAVFSDQLGAGFEERMKELYPPEEPAAEAKPKESGTAKEESKSSIGDLIVTGERPRTSSFNRGKGNLFLVDRRTMHVVWSTYERAKDAHPDQLHNVSSRIVSRLKNAWKGKPGR